MPRMHNPPHPGGILWEELEELEVDPQTFAVHIGVKPEELIAVLDKKAPFTRDLAEKISGAIQGPTADTWLAVQKEFDAWREEQGASDITSD